MPWQRAIAEMLGGCIDQHNDSTFDDTGCYVQDCGFPVDSDPQPPTYSDDRTWLDLIHYPVMALADPADPFRSLRVAGGGVATQSADVGSRGGATAPCTSPPRTDSPCGATVRGTTITSSTTFKKRKADSLNKTTTVTDQLLQEAPTATTTAAGKRIKTESNSPMAMSSSSKQESHHNPTSSCSQSGKEADSNKLHASSSKASDVVLKTDYIHVRARRGQATDSHSLAERVRREKISDRMKYLQELVPGCNKITGKAGMLDEIINYVQSLQKQVEFLSMKLAAVNPLFDTSPDSFPVAKEKVCGDGIPLGMATIVPQLLNSSNPLLHMATSGLDAALNLQEAAAFLNVAVSAAAQPPPSVFGNAALHQLPSVPPGWNADLQCLLSDDFRQAKASFCTPFPGAGASNFQMQM